MNNGEIEILLVEDDDSDAELTIRALVKNRITNKILHVKNGEDALDFLFCKGLYSEGNMNRNKNIKLILLDMKMPKMNGLEVLKAIKSDQRTRLIPVVFLTSSKEEQDIIKSYNLGVNSYIVKPIEIDKFFKTIAELGVYWLIVNQPPTSF